MCRINVNKNAITTEGLTFIISFIESLLVDDGVNGNGSLTAQTDKKTLALTTHPLCPYVLHSTKMNFLPSLSVSDDQFSLSPPNGYKAVHSLNAGLHRLSY